MGYVSIRRYRNRYFGHPELLRLVAALGQARARQGDQLVMVGDLSQPRGGLMSSSHRSHQNGLDVDIWFKLAPSAAVANRDTAGPADPPSMVTADGEDLSPLWGERPTRPPQDRRRGPAGGPHLRQPGHQARPVSAGV